MNKALSFLFCFCIGGLGLFFLWIIISNFSIELPSQKKPLLFFSNQCHQDLRLMAIHAMKSAKKSLFLVTFGLNDISILETLEKKAKENLEMKIFYDRRASPNISLSNHQAYALNMRGLLHQKILIIDKELVFLGSANMTKTSFAADENFVCGFYSPALADFLLKKAPFFSGSFKTVVEGKTVELYLLPDLDNQALTALLSIIKEAHHSLFVAMFTLTHPLLVAELIAAKRRGVQVRVALSSQMAWGASKESIEKLQQAKVDILLSSRGDQLFHYKFALVDESIFISGSTNWTRAAFAKNHDCFFILHSLSSIQKKFMKRLISIIENEALSCTNSSLLLPSTSQP